MKTAINAINSHSTKSIQGPMDALAVESLRSELDELVNNSHGDVIIDLNLVDFIDSSGIGALVFLFKRLSSQKRKLQLRGANGQPLQLIKYLRIDQAIKLLPAENSDTIAAAPQQGASQ